MGQGGSDRIGRRSAAATTSSKALNTICTTSTEHNLYNSLTEAAARVYIVAQEAKMIQMITIITAQNFA